MISKRLDGLFGRKCFTYTYYIRSWFRSSTYRKGNENQEEIKRTNTLAAVLRGFSVTAIWTRWRRKDVGDVINQNPYIYTHTFTITATALAPVTHSVHDVSPLRFNEHITRFLFEIVKMLLSCTSRKHCCQLSRRQILFQCRVCLRYRVPRDIFLAFKLRRNVFPCNIVLP